MGERILSSICKRGNDGLACATVQVLSVTIVVTWSGWRAALGVRQFWSYIAKHHAEIAAAYGYAPQVLKEKIAYAKNLRRSGSVTRDEGLLPNDHPMKRNSSGERLPTICFVLAANDLGLYADMVAVAALSVRRLHPHARIILVTDEPTAHAIDRRSHAVRHIVSGIIVRSTGTDDPATSSRYLRTVLRQLIRGDYLYLDSDAVAVRPLDRGWPKRADLAMARDRNRRGITPLALPGIEKLRAKLGWEFRMDRYLNAGVMFVRDTPGAHAFYAEWHQRWKQTLSLGMWQDQFSLNIASTTGIARIAVLPDRDNWVTHSTAMLRGRARIFHFFASTYGDKIPDNTLLGHLITRFQRDGGLDEVTIACAARDNFPWMNDVRLKYLLASGLYIRAAGLVVPHIIRRIRRRC